MTVALGTMVYHEAKQRRWAKWQPFARCLILPVGKEQHRPVSLFSPGCRRLHKAHRRGHHLMNLGRAAETNGPDLVGRLADLTEMVKAMADALDAARVVAINAQMVGGTDDLVSSVPTADLRTMTRLLDHAQVVVERIHEVSHD